jgi:hypothetical protein
VRNISSAGLNAEETGAGLTPSPTSQGLCRVTARGSSAGFPAVGTTGTIGGSVMVLFSKGADGAAAADHDGAEGDRVEIDENGPCAFLSHPAAILFL